MIQNTIFGNDAFPMTRSYERIIGNENVLFDIDKELLFEESQIDMIDEIVNLILDEQDLL